MPDLKISQLPVATTPLAGTELVPIVQGGVTDRTTVAAFLSAGLPVSATTLSASGAVTLSGGTANGVLYLDGSKVATSGSALTFDGTLLRSSTYLGLSTNTTPDTSTGDAIFYKSAAGATLSGFNVVLETGSAGSRATRYTIDNIGQAIWAISGSEQMRLDSTGLGIGTSSPAYRLQLTNTVASNFVSVVSVNTGTAGLLLGDTDSATVGRVEYDNASNFMALYTNGSERMRLDSSGNLGLGVTPSAWGGGAKTLDMTSTGSFEAIGANSTSISYNRYYNGTNNIYKTTGSAGIYALNSSGQHVWYTAPSWDGTGSNVISFTQAMTLDASGNLGVGHTNPAWRLDVETSTGRIQFRDGSNTGGTSNGTGLVSTNSAASALAALNLRADTFTFITGTTERARITSTGNVVAGGSVALATNATDGFLYVPTCAGTPTGTPTAITGMAPIVVDTTNNKMYFYSGGTWRDAGP